MKIIPVASEFAWHNLRAKNVGGSEIAALFGLSPYTTLYQLWHIKNGTLPPEDLSKVERVQAGNFIEPAIAAWAAVKWNIRLTKFAGYVLHPSIKGMGCTPDYLNTDATLVVQIKNVDSLQFYKEWEAEGDVITKAPMHILLQVQHELACTGIAQAWLVVLVGGNRLLRMLIEARPATIAKLEAAVTAFWSSLSAKVEPSPDFATDGAAIAALYVEADKGKIIDLSASNRAHALVGEWLHGNELETQGEALKTAAKAELTLMLGDAAKATIGSATVSSLTVRASAGKLVTPEMVGTVVGAKAAYRRFSISTQEEGK